MLQFNKKMDVTTKRTFIFQEKNEKKKLFFVNRYNYKRCEISTFDEAEDSEQVKDLLRFEIHNHLTHLLLRAAKELKALSQGAEADFFLQDHH